jgi:uncharacterized protein
MPLGLNAYQWVLTALEISFLVGGGIVWWQWLKIQSVPILPRWRISAVGFVFAAAIVLVGMGVGTAFGALIAKALAFWIEDASGFDVFIHNAGMHLGILPAIAIAVRASRMLEQSEDQTLDASSSAPTSPALAALPLHRRVWWGFCAFLGTFVLVSITGVLWQRLLHGLGISAADQELVGILGNTRDPLKIILMALVAVVLAPITEELVFRAGLFRFLRDRVPGWTAHVVTAAAFAALHGTVSVTLPLFVFGLVFSFVYERTGRIEITMIAHGLFNLNTIVCVLADLQF